MHTAKKAIIMEKKLLTGKQILIVDDEPDVLDTLADLLADYSTIKALSFDEAKSILNTQHIDIAILDIMGVDGYDLLQLATEKGITSVMLTAHALSPENVVKSHKGGASFYIPKEEMVRIESFLEDILDAQQKGNDPWERWMERLGGYCERHFGPDWQKGDQIFWEKFPFH